MSTPAVMVWVRVTTFDREIRHDLGAGPVDLPVTWRGDLAAWN
jgi:hypothetical protein